MAKDIVIQDEYFKTVHMSGVTRLRTDLEGGGECYWVPEDESMELITKTITENGVYRAMDEDANGYSNVTVDIAHTFGPSDEGKVVSNSALVSQSSRTITTNGIYDTTTNNSVTVETSSNLSTKTITVNGTYAASSDNVDGYSDVTVSVPNTYTQSDEGKVVSNSALVSQSSRTITTNGIYDTTTNNSVTVETSSNLSTKTITVNGTYAASSDNVDGYSDVIVSVPNTYTQSDEGKVVSNSALVSQSSRTITTNGTYDTTTNNSITVETSSNLSTKTINVNGTYAASSDNVDGYSDVTVSVPNTYTQSDEGKVVSNSALVSQSSRTITTNGTYDTTTNNSVTVDVSGGADIDGKSLIEGGLTEIHSSEITVIKPHAFFGQNALSSVNLNGVLAIGSSAFQDCSSISTVSFPYCTSVGEGAFTRCESLRDAYIPMTTFVGSRAFYNCVSLLSVDVRNAENIYESTFYSCYSLQNINIQRASVIGSYAFRYCSALLSIEGENVNTINNYAFNQCITLSFASFPKLESFGTNTFAQLSAMAAINLGSVISNIPTAAFANCINLKSIYILASSICSLQSVYAFRNTPLSDSSYLSGEFGSIYVLPSLVSVYKTAPLWSFYSERIVAYVD